MDINCDMGESYGHFKIGNDVALFPYITSCNVACGFHGGDPLSIEKTIQQAINYKVQIGAHPSYPDLMGFGRKRMILPADELQAVIKYQISAIKGMTESLGGKMTYVKPHGALYNSLAENEDEALATIAAIQSVDQTLAVMGLAGSSFEKLAKQKKIKFIREGFADRRYLPNGQLMPRTNKEALITSVEDTIKQVITIIKEQKVETEEGFIPMKVDSICIHGDNPLAPDIVRGIKEASQKEGFSIQKFYL